MSKLLVSAVAMYEWLGRLAPGRADGTGAIRTGMQGLSACVTCGVQAMFKCSTLRCTLQDRTGQDRQDELQQSTPVKENLKQLPDLVLPSYISQQLCHVHIEIMYSVHRSIARSHFLVPPPYACVHEDGSSVRLYSKHSNQRRTTLSIP